MSSVQGLTIQQLIAEMTPEQLQQFDPQGLLSDYISKQPQKDAVTSASSQSPVDSVPGLGIAPAARSAVAESKISDVINMGPGEQQASKQRPSQRLKKAGKHSNKAAKKPHVLVPPLHPSGTVAKAIRPLNSWIAYRCYYSPMFASIQQKEISGFLTHLWRNDPFKSKWTVLAKAYSVIRDVRGKKSAPLDLFLALNAPFLGIIPPSEYFQLLGWEMSVSVTGERTLCRIFTPDLSGYDSDLVASENTVHDVIQHSYVEGYIPADGAEFLLASPGSSLLTQQVIAVRTAFDTASEAQPAQKSDSVAQISPSTSLPTSEQPGQQLSPDSHLGSHAPDDQYTAFSIQADSTRGIETATHSVTSDDIQEAMRQELVQEHAKIMADAQVARDIELAGQHSGPGNDLQSKFRKSGTVYPHLAHFTADEGREPPLDLSFDPFEGSPWDTYNVSDFLDYGGM